ncbi:methylated-DNA--[protein]-cysteine S-methyltransferase [Candidatus Fukatsuia symbiotica]|uniref:Methylated-DNA--protein-cysteine methyltransferase n=1 Tax=Candidatus Fukatsuia symbiotica TaxID=1878942 RepID=A0A2U8I5A9_9GAMM|nr:methylated-DNA--[protein]-cysteine S-methyltransferase [Candidatus Fukatsuia symbiotica]AWK14319.1 O-6-alkylguanine-DNA--cysteine-protein methyltransferase [Candidatus Fukatsuia symbiotica]MEA9444576.1 methylated-DNA--[protein]-cysteine S-methyltransferase [Candidatus Fukatsuia symbiotica]
MYHYYIDSPPGFATRFLQIQASEIGIKRIDFVNEKTVEVKPTSLLLHCVDELEKYFAGKLKTFTVALDPGGTDFQKKVWCELQKIKFGETWSYKQLALAVESANYCRAVGAANAKNLIAIIIPCHRVIGNNGHLTGYAAGLTIKQWLIEHEGSGDKITCQANG